MSISQKFRDSILLVLFRFAGIKAFEELPQSLDESIIVRNADVLL